MIKAIILDDGYHSKNVVVKFEKNNYQQVSFNYFVNMLCMKHNSEYLVKTVYFERLGEVDSNCFEVLTAKFSFGKKVIHDCEEFENLWESDEVVDGIDLY
mgnify:CR=1 FL=1